MWDVITCVVGHCFLLLYEVRLYYVLLRDFGNTQPVINQSFSLNPCNDLFETWRIFLMFYKFLSLTTRSIRLNRSTKARY